MTNGALIEAKYPTTHTLYQLEQTIVREDSGVMKLYKNGKFLGLVTMLDLEKLLNDKYVEA